MDRWLNDRYKDLDVDWLIVLKAIWVKVLTIYLGFYLLASLCIFIASGDIENAISAGWLIGAFGATFFGVYRGCQQRYILTGAEGRRRRLGLHPYDYYQSFWRSAFTGFVAIIIFFIAQMQMILTHNITEYPLRLIIIILASGAAIPVLASIVSHSMFKHLFSKY